MFIGQSRGILIFSYILIHSGVFIGRRADVGNSCLTTTCKIPGKKETGKWGGGEVHNNHAFHCMTERGGNFHCMTEGGGKPH